MTHPSPRRLRGLLVGLLLLLAGPALALEPFTADYTANYMGLQANGRMALAPEGQQRWKYSLEVSGAGARLVQSTTFEARGAHWRPLSSLDTQRGESGLAAMLVKNRSVSANYDWEARTASWSGDIRPERAGPVKLKTGDIDGLMMNLALARDFAAGKPMDYRMVEDGRVRQQTFRPDGNETIDVAGRQRQATRVVWGDDSRRITAWIVEGLPVPARILQQRNGRDHIDLRLKSISG